MCVGFCCLFLLFLVGLGGMSTHSGIARYPTTCACTSRSRNGGELTEYVQICCFVQRTILFYWDRPRLGRERKVLCYYCCVVCHMKIICCVRSLVLERWREKNTKSGWPQGRPSVGESGPPASAPSRTRGFIQPRVLSEIKASVIGAFWANRSLAYKETQK